MRILIVLSYIVAALMLAAFGLWWLLQAPLPLPAPERGGAFDHVTVIQPGESRREAQTLTLEGAAIGAVAASEGEAKGPYAGMYVLPGLINMHAHHPPKSIPVARDLFPLLFLMHGVTTVRDAGDIDGGTVAPLREEIRAGKIAGPRIFACGPFVDGVDKTWENTRNVTDPAQAKAVIQAIKAEGNDCIKLYNSLTPDVLAALVAAAKDEGMPTIGHVSRYVPYPGGIGDVQHFTGAPVAPNTDPRGFPQVMDAWATFDDAQMDRTVKATLDAGAANTPTLVTIAKYANYARYEDMRASAEAALLPRFFADVIWHPTEGLPRDVSATNLNRLKVAVAAEQRLVKRLYDVGAPLHIGTDTVTAFVVPGVDVHDEMRLFAEAGIPLEQVWKIATSGNGGYLKPGLGRLEAGAPADFLIFRADPTADLANLSTLEAVVADGRLYTKADLDSRFARLKEQWSNPIVDTIMVEATRMAMARFKEPRK
jgi:imidazolonepropionase-like amidohydrolase